ncbi:MFS transporter [Dasania marina]|uniref:MFS transporter n=1 Tax=Dasania marina TaxID=471499 RepID=UPI000376896F|nr:MFS transporter [Dasania marina]
MNSLDNTIADSKNGLLKDSLPDDWPATLGAAAAAYGIGMLSLLVLPFLIGATMSSLGLSGSQAGWLGSAELLSVTLGSFIVAPWIGRLPRRTLAMSGAALAIAANLVSMTSLSYELLMLCRAIAGLGCGLALAAGNATVACSKNPEKMAAHMSIFFVVIMVALMMIFARVGDMYGYQGSYGALAATIAVVSLLLLGLPQHPSAAVHAEAAAGTNNKQLFSLAGIVMMLAMFCFQMRDTMSWAFVERIGAGVGYSSAEVGNLLSLQAVLGLLGPVIATLMGSRFGLKMPVIIGVLGSGLVTVMVLLSTDSVALYTATVSLISISYFYSLAYLTSLAAELDKDGRIVAASGGLLIAGSAVAPVISGYILDAGGYVLMGWVAAGVVGLTLLCALIALGTLNNRTLRSANTNNKA